MKRIVTLATGTALAAAAITVASGTPASAYVHDTGHYCANSTNVAVREQAGGAARDNLDLHQTFQVERIASDNWAYGYKIVNGVHGYVLRSSLDPC